MPIRSMIGVGCHGLPLNRANRARRIAFQQRHDFRPLHRFDAVVDVVGDPRHAKLAPRRHRLGISREKSLIRRLQDLEKQVVAWIVALRPIQLAAVRHDPGVTARALGNRQGQPLVGRDPAPSGDGAVLHRAPARLPELFRRADLGDEFRVVRAEARHVHFPKYALPVGDPFAFGARSGSDQRLRLLALQHLPVAFRLAPRQVDGVGAHPFGHRQRVIFLLRTDVRAGPSAPRSASPIRRDRGHSISSALQFLVVHSRCKRKAKASIPRLNIPAPLVRETTIPQMVP